MELIRTAAADLLRVIHRLGPIGPTVEGYDNLHWWLGEWAWVQDKYRALYLQWEVMDSPEASLRPLVAEHLVSYVSSLSPRLSTAIGEDFDADGVATVLLPLLFRMNDYRQKGINRTLSDEEMLDGTATFVQVALFPSTPPGALTARAAPHTSGRRTHGRVRRRPEAPRRAGASEPIPATVQRILDAGATTFAVRGFQHSSVQDVLDTARVGRGTFYKYFDDKADLLVTLAEDCMARLEELAGRFADTIDTDDDGRSLRRWLEECLTLHRRYQGVFRALLHEESRHPVLGAAPAQRRSHPAHVRRRPGGRRTCVLPSTSVWVRCCSSRCWSAARSMRSAPSTTSRKRGSSTSWPCSSTAVCSAAHPRPIHCRLASARRTWRDSESAEGGAAVEVEGLAGHPGRLVRQRGRHTRSRRRRACRCGRRGSARGPRRPGRSSRAA